MSSVFKPVCDAVATVLATISGAPTIVVRKTDVVKARDVFPASPLCIVSYGTDAPAGWGTIGDGASDYGTIGKAYSVVIAVYRANLADVDDSATNPDFIQAAKQALNKGTLTGVSAVWNTEIESHEEWEKQPFGQGAEVSRFALLFDSAELRAT